MIFLVGLFLIATGLYALFPVISEKFPQARHIIAEISPYAHYYGLVALFCAAVYTFFIPSILNASSIIPLAAFLAIPSWIVLAAIGLLLAYPYLTSKISRSDWAQMVSKFYTRLLVVQKTLGMAAVALGVLNLCA